HYWPSKPGRMHEGLKRRNLDYVGEMISKCHANGIDVIVYYSQTHDNYAYDHHPDWRIVSKDSTVSREKGGRYGLVCPTNSDYLEYAKEILTELLTTYEFEGLFLDMPFWTDICYCQSCRKRFFEETGEEIPKIVNWDNPVWLKFAHSRQNWLNEFVNAITACVKSVKPNVSIEQNFAAVGSGWRHGDTERILDACDYAGGDYYGGYLEQTFMCKYYNSVTPNKPFSYITSRCDPNLYAHTVSRCKEDLLIHTMNALVHGGAFSMCDAMNPDGTITKDVYKNSVKHVYETSAKYEGYVSGDLLCDVAIWYNSNMKANDNFMKSPMGVGEIMREYNVPYDVIGSRNLKTLNRQVLSINDVYEITDEEMSDIEAYINRGGTVFITGKLAHKRFEELLGVLLKGESEYTYTYLNPSPDYAELFESFNESSPYPIEHTAYECKSTGDAQILATLTYPYTKRSDKDFSAIHSDPPGIHTDMPAVLLKNVGKGRVLWAVAPLELTKAHFCRQTIYRLISSLLKTREFISNAPDFVEIVGWKKNDKRYFSAINQQIKSPVYPITDIHITLPYQCKAVNLLTPSEGELSTNFADGKTTINLPKLDIFHIIEVEY
ncbi:MAG: family 10 glycosylhydrolase, partial [Oscillospiraceae bacterium]